MLILVREHYNYEKNNIVSDQLDRGCAAPCRLVSDGAL